MIAAIVQARMGSHRLPGKMSLPLGGVPALAFMVRRVRRSPEVQRIVLATTEDPADDVLAELAAGEGVEVVRGSREDVLDRFYRAAAALGLDDDDAIVRLTGDCPFADPAVIAAVVRAFRAHPECAYASNVSPPTYPDGLDCEVVRMSALRQAWTEAREPHQREHVTPFISENPRRFPAINVTCPEGDLSAHRWTLDEPEDYRFLQALAERLPEGFAMTDVLRLLQDGDPALAAINRHLARNEGGIETMRQSMDLRAPRLTIAESERWWRRREGLIPAGTMTLSKGPTQYVDGVAPKYLVRGSGSHVWDADGNEYIDYPLGLGAVTLGHRHPEVTRAIEEQLETSGITFSLMHPLEVLLAEKLREVVPCCDMARFGKNGSDATSAAVRTARAYTGRSLVARCGYHGWHDWAIDETYGIRSRGVPNEVRGLTVAFRYNDPASLQAVFDAHPGEIAAVILEPMTVTPPRDGFLEAVRDLTHTHGAVLVFDEIITGFRWARGGAQEYFGVTPDLATMGKGVANGMPLSILVGRSEVMSALEDVFFSATFGGECLSLAAALKVIEVMEREDYWGHIKRLGARLQDGYREMAREFRLEQITECAGVPQWTLVGFTEADGLDPLLTKSLFQQEMLKRGVLFSGSQFLSLAHTNEDVERTLDAYRESFKVLRFAVDNQCVSALLQGRPVQPVFRKI